MRVRTRPSGNRRYIGLLLCMALAFGAITVRLVWIQAVQASELSEKAFLQRLKDVELPPRRGTIYDRDGEPLALSVEAKTIFVSPNQIKTEDKALVAKILADALGGDAATYQSKLERDSGFEYIARNVEMERVSALKDELKRVSLLEKRDIGGIGFLEDYRRLYPSGELACQVLGYVGVEGGLSGIESQYEQVLGGTPGVVLGERDPHGRPIPGGVQKTIDPTHGKDVVLTIDKDIQYRTQIELNKAVKKFSAASGSVIIMNPRNGEIYAMASAPGFNPNNFGKAKASATRNRPVTDTYEPGSTMKCLTASAAVDRGLYKPNSKFSLPPTIRVGGRTIHESHGRGSVRWSLTEIVAHSSNVGTVKIGMKLGKKGLYDSLARFGLTETTGVDYPGETKGWLLPPNQWSASSIGNIPFGQGVSLTPLQLSRAVSGIANEGNMPTPHFLLDMPSSKTAEPNWPVKRAISAKAAASVTKMLEKVVTEGTGGSASVPGYRVAGKTGTAQKARPGGGGYGGGKYVGSFIGYLPAEDPQVLVCVTMDEPKRGYYGGTVAAPTFAKLAQFSVEHLKIPPATDVAEAKDSKKGQDAGVGTVSASSSRD